MVHITDAREKLERQQQRQFTEKCSARDVRPATVGCLQSVRDLWLAPHFLRQWAAVADLNLWRSSMNWILSPLARLKKARLDAAVAVVLNQLQIKI